jgi:uncharacterized membrane protein YeaQ/YmgE (transglycosylase-associated protein family)
MMLGVWIVFGLVTGIVVNVLVTKKQGAWFLDVLLGIVGAVVAGKISSLNSSSQTADSGTWSLFVAVVGALVTVMAYRTLTQRRRA